MPAKPLTELKNIGQTVAAKLHSLGIVNESDLNEVGSARAYRWLSERYPESHLPVCYYLYSLEGAIQDKHWDDFSESEKAELRRSAGLGN